MNISKKTLLLPVAVLATGTMSTSAYAWGGHGHHAKTCHHTCKPVVKPKPKPRKTCTQSFYELIAKAKRLEVLANRKYFECQYAQAAKLRATAAKLRRLAQQLPCAC